MRKKLFFWGLFFIGFNLFAQTGPGGVENIAGTTNLVLWYSPESSLTNHSDVFPSNGDEIKRLNDQSSKANFATGAFGNSPTYNTGSAFNGYSYLTFDGASNENLVFNDVTDLPFGTSARTYIFVINGTATNQSLMGYGSTVNNGNKITFSSFENEDFTIAVHGYRRGYDDTSGPFNPAKRILTSMLPASTTLNSVIMFINSTFYPSVVIAGSNKSVNTEGTTLNHLGRSFDGNMAELIFFDKRINFAERIIIDNYLAAKYDLTIDAANDFYDEDTSGDNFDHKVAGIGQASDGSSHTDSQGTGIIKMQTPSALSNGDFLFWGEDVKDADYDFSISTDYTERIDTKWRVSKTNNTSGDVGLGTVSVSVAASDLDLTGKNSCTPLKLIVSSSSTFTTKTTYDLTLSSGVYTASGVSFSDNDYFTLEYIDQIVLDGTTAYNGAGTLNKPNTSDDCYKLLVKTNTLTLSEAADVREIEVESGAILAVNSGIRLQVTNGIKNNGDIRLVGNSQLVQTHTSTSNLNSGTGNLYVDQKATTTSVYHSGYWSSPVSTTVDTPFSINDVLKDGNVPTAATPTFGEAGNINFIAGYDGNAATPIAISTRWLATFNNAADWTRFVSPTSAVLSPGLGWNMKSVGAPFTFKGKPNDGNYSFSIDQNKYSLLGNPYPSALDSEAFITDNAGEFNGILYIYDSSSDNTHVRGSYTGTYKTISSGVAIGSGLYLPVGQAFFITREVAGSGTLTFKNSQRTLTTLTDTDAIVAKSSNKKESSTSTNLSVIKIGFQFNLNDGQKRNRQVAVAFRGLTNNYDRGFDAEMWSLQPTDFYLTVNDREAPFIITSIEDFRESIEVPLVVQLDTDRKVTFSIDEIKNIDATVYLLDKFTNTYYNLSEGSKTINLLKNKFIDRFFITFNKQALSVADNLLNNSFTIHHQRDRKELLIKNNGNSSVKKVTISTILGQKIIEIDNEIQLYKKEITVNTNPLSSSFYIISIETSEGKISKKFF